MSGSYYFALVGGGDRPLLELEFNQKKEKEQRHLCQLIAHASLDLVEARARATRFVNSNILLPVPLYSMKEVYSLVRFMNSKIFST